MSALDVTDRWIMVAAAALRRLAATVAAWLLRPWRRATAPHSGRHCHACTAIANAAQALDAMEHLAAMTPAPGAAPGQAPDAAAHVPAPVDDAAAPLPLRAVAPVPPQGQPALGSLVSPPPAPPGGIDVGGAIHYRRPDGLIAVIDQPNGSTRTVLYTADSLRMTRQWGAREIVDDPRAIVRPYVLGSAAWWLGMSVLAAS